MRTGRAAVRDPGRLLDLCESGWAPALRGKVLVAEAEPERHGDLLPAVAVAISRCDARTAAERWPACLLMTVVGAVAAGYRHGSAWAVWWRACGKRIPSAAEAAEWERAFRAAATIGRRRPGLWVRDRGGPAGAAAEDVVGLSVRLRGLRRARCRDGPAV